VSRERQVRSYPNVSLRSSDLAELHSPNGANPVRAVGYTLY
jgi:hypothetical protein